MSREQHVKSLNTAENMSHSCSKGSRDNIAETLLFYDQLKHSRLSISDSSRVNSTGAVDEPPSFTTHFS